MLKRTNRRSGFTLPEVLVTVAIVAVLAAVVVPAVTQQIGKADAPSFTASVNSLRTSITSFVSDVRAYPGRIENLQIAPTTAGWPLYGNGTGVGAPTYTAAQVARWKGPYENSGNATGAIQVGMGWTTTNVLMDSLGYLVVEITKTAGADTTDAHQLEAAVDSASQGMNPAAGLVRYLPAGGSAALSPANKVRLFIMSSAK